MFSPLKLKKWEDGVGSVRPLAGTDLPRLAVRVEIDWASLDTQVCARILLLPVPIH